MDRDTKKILEKMWEEKRILREKKGIKNCTLVLKDSSIGALVDGLIIDICARECKYVEECSKYCDKIKEVKKNLCNNLRILNKK